MSRDVSVGNVFGYEMFMFIFTYALQAFKAYCAIWVRRSPPGFSTRVTTRQHPAAKGGTVGEKCPVKFCLNADFHVTFRDLLTCRKATTWDRRPYLSSEGRRAEDFFRPKKSDVFGRVRIRELG